MPRGILKMGEDIMIWCDWCHKMIVVKQEPKNHLSKKYVACSKECQKMLSSVSQSKEWKSLSENELKTIGGVYGMKFWYEVKEVERINKVKKYLEANRRSQMAKVKKFIPKSAKTILKAHSEVTFDDPDRLSPEFIDNMLGKKSPS